MQSSVTPRANLTHCNKLEAFCSPNDGDSQSRTSHSAFWQSLQATGQRGDYVMCAVCVRVACELTRCTPMKCVLPSEGWGLLIKTLIRVPSSPSVPAVEWIPQSARSPAVGEEVNWTSHKSPSTLTLHPLVVILSLCFFFFIPISYFCPHLSLPLHRPSFHSNRLPWKLGDSAVHPIPARALREVFREGKVCFCFLHFTGIQMKL